MTDKESECQKAHCNSCLRQTNHRVLHVEGRRWSELIDEESGLTIDGGETWHLLRCLGCDTIRARRTHWFSEDVDDQFRPKIHEEYFPSAITRQRPLWRRQIILPTMFDLEAYNGLCDEIYNALAIGAHRLAVMGIRALVERIMINISGDHGGFVKNIEKFFSEGYVAPRSRQMFKDTLIESGHAAMHRNFNPSAAAVNILLDIVEGVMYDVYCAAHLAESVKRIIPRRGG